MTITRAQLYGAASRGSLQKQKLNQRMNRASIDINHIKKQRQLETNTFLLTLDICSSMRMTKQQKNMPTKLTPSIHPNYKLEKNCKNPNYKLKKICKRLDTKVAAMLALWQMPQDAYALSVDQLNTNIELLPNQRSTRQHRTCKI